MDRRSPLRQPRRARYPEAIITAFEDHRTIARIIDADTDRAADVLGAFERVRVDMGDGGCAVEDQGVDSFDQCFAHPVETLDTEAHRLSRR